ncbi:cholesterol esterase [Chytriomyces hyalinus]|nr:cholesterol esterase [Chytriomyces hyalinus]
MLTDSADNLTQPERDAARIATTVDAMALIRKWDYPCEEHTVSGKDGTRLTIQRILPAGFNASRHHQPRPVLLWPGFGGSANCFLCAPSREGNLAFLLADAGFDVWLGNPRGVVYTQFFNEKDGGANPWAFSIDDIIHYDVPATVDFVLAKTRSKQLTYVCVSQGTTTIFAALSIMEDLNRKINLVIALAPTLKPVHAALTPILHPIFRGYRWVAGDRAFPSTLSEVAKQYAPPFLTSKFMSLCTYIGFQWDCSKIGDDARQMAMMPHSFHGTSTRVVDHWLQTMEDSVSFSHYIILSAKKRGFTHLFDHVTHAAASPVKYPTKHITTPLHLMYSRSDSITDINVLQVHLPSHTVFTEIENYSHPEFLWGTDAPEKIFGKVLSLIFEAVSDNAKK